MKHSLVPLWDLSDLYKNISSIEIETDKKELLGLAEKFALSYRGKINSEELTPRKLKKIIMDLEVIELLSSKLACYSYLAFSVQTTDNKVSRFYQSIQEYLYDLSSKLVFFTTEWRSLPETKALELLEATELEEYKYYLQEQRKFAKHTLSEAEETLLTKKAPAGAAAFVKLYDKLLSQLTVELKLPQQTNKSYPLAEITKIMSEHPSRKIREKAHRAVDQVLRSQQLIFTEILNTLLLDKRLSDEIRSYDFPQARTYLDDSLDKETIGVMTETITRSYALVATYYHSKAKLQNLDGLHEWDRYSAVLDTEELKIDWAQAKQMVLENFYQFDAEFGQIAEKFFAGNWIDAKVRKGKQSGGYCMYIPGVHPYILVNFTNKLSDVRVLAHELGHGIHGVLRLGQSPLNFYGSTPAAEIASIFCEEIVFRSIYQSLTDTKQKINLLGGRIQEDFATVFRQNVFHVFESKLHVMRKEGELSSEQISELWQQELQLMFGGSLRLSDAHKSLWMQITHIFHSNFYTYSYCFGKLLASAFYNNYLVHGKDFITGYKKALALGGAKSTYEIVAQAGSYDLNSESFWQAGLETIKTNIAEFQTLVNTIR